MVIKTMFMDQPTTAVALSPSRPLAIGLAVMVAGTILFGIFPNVILKFAEASIRTLL